MTTGALGRAGMSGQDALRRLAADIGDVPSDLQRLLRLQLVKAAQPIAADARSRASWSTRIPRSIGIRTSFTGARPGLYIRARASIAPHARPFENLGDEGTFRHPVFGDRDRWVTQRARPFLFPAARAGAAGVEAAAGAAVDAALRANNL